MLREKRRKEKQESIELKYSEIETNSANSEIKIIACELQCTLNW